MSHVAHVAAKILYDKLQCQTDIFSVTAPGNNAPPVICGSNSGEHSKSWFFNNLNKIDEFFLSVYVDASDMCNDLGFNLGSTGSTVTRSWTIKITQYDCNYDNLAPDGCTQYFWGQTTDTVQTYNFDSGAHLASQNQNICIRRERGTCQICWATTAEGDFEVSTAMTGAAGTIKVASGCCGYKNDGMLTSGWDCVKIPTPSKAPGTTLGVVGAYGFCGGELGTIAGSIAAATVCSKSVPFNIRFLSDLFETITEMAKTPNGFRLAYTLKGC